MVSFAFFDAMRASAYAYTQTNKQICTQSDLRIMIIGKTRKKGEKEKKEEAAAAAQHQRYQDKDKLLYCVFALHFNVNVWRKMRFHHHVS